MICVRRAWKTAGALEQRGRPQGNTRLDILAERESENIEA
jgi:hypothetical protein